MKIDFQGRKVLVTGSTSGIGFATANAFVAAGASVVINGRSQESIDGALQRLRADVPPAEAQTAGVTGFSGDLADPRAIDGLMATHPEFDIVVNNIGTYGPKDFFEISDTEWGEIFQSNVMSGVRVSRAYVPGMVERGWGRVVFVSSESAINIPTDMIHYGFTKTSQLAISRGLAKRLAGTGVTVNAVLPGPTMTEGVIEMLTGGEDRSDAEVDVLGREFVEDHRGSSLIKRMATVDEVANMIIYASSEQASATTGSTLRVDGGVVETVF